MWGALGRRTPHPVFGRSQRGWCRIHAMSMSVTEFSVEDWEHGIDTEPVTAATVDPLEAMLVAEFVPSPVPEWAAQDFVSWMLSFPTDGGGSRQCGGGDERSRVLAWMRAGVRWSETFDVSDQVSVAAYVAVRTAGVSHPDVVDVIGSVGGGALFSAYSALRAAGVSHRHACAAINAPVSADLYVKALAVGAVHTEILQVAATGGSNGLLFHIRARAAGASFAEVVEFRKVGNGNAREYATCLEGGFASHDQLLTLARIKRTEFGVYVKALQAGIMFDDLLAAARKGRIDIAAYTRGLKRGELHDDWIARHTAQGDRW